MKQLVYISLFILTSASGCKKPVNINAADLRERDETLSLRANAVILQKEKILPELYEAQLEELRKEEIQLFEDARQCDFGDNLTEYNYWHRSRLKFPGKIEIAQDHTRQ